jgi:uncharacterized protein (TIGR03382 family)
VLAQTDSDGDAFDGDEILSVPILLGMGVLAALAWSVYRRRSPKSQKWASVRPCPIGEAC